MSDARRYWKEGFRFFLSLVSFCGEKGSNNNGKRLGMPGGGKQNHFVFLHARFCRSSPLQRLTPFFSSV